MGPKVRLAVGFVYTASINSLLFSMGYLILLGCIFALIYSFGSNTNGTKSPQVMIAGGLGWAVIFLLSIVFSYLDHSFLFWKVLWTGVVIFIVASMVFKKMFKYSFLDELDAQRRFNKKLRMIEELAQQDTAKDSDSKNTVSKRYWQV